MATHIPEDLIKDILLLSPLKSLLRFQCVSRKVFHIIRSESFTPARSSGDLLISLQSHLGARTLRKLCVSGPQHECFVFDEPVPSSTYLTDSCSGLLVFYLGSSTVCAMNPSTRQHRMLPPCPFEAKTLRRLTIGYDSITDDYKIVALSYLSVWIFGLKSNRWRRVHKDFPCDITSRRSLGDGSCFADGALHFLHREKDFGPYYSHKVVAFELARETFSLLIDHPTKEYARRDELSLHCFGGHLSMSTLKLVELYVRKRTEGANFGWIKLLSVNKEDLLAGGRAIGYSHKGNRILIFSKQDLFSYDVKEKRMQKTDIGKTRKSMQALNLFLCPESINVPLKS